VHRIERVYAAIAWGLPPQPRGAIEQPIGRHPKDRKRMAVTDGGKRALTHYQVLRAAGDLACWLRVTLGTGRTHQIRVHLAALGLGIVGDPLYRPRRLPKLSPECRRQVQDLGRIALHACRLGFEHPITGQKLRFEQPPPDEFGALFESLARNAIGS
jgi:23S rRNA pseudouridine1911/1915/1917 synthase